MRRENLTWKGERDTWKIEKSGLQEGKKSNWEGGKATFGLVRLVRTEKKKRVSSQD